MRLCYNSLMKTIAYIETDFPDKFGIPRQSGLAADLTGRIVFVPPYNIKEAVKGLSDFNYIWLLWGFEDAETEHFRATVRPPRLGGNTTMGVFATRSPFRPNSIGLSSVKLTGIEYTEDGPVLFVQGADLRDHTPIYDIKPYLKYVDCHEDALDGFAAQGQSHVLKVNCDEQVLAGFPESKKEALLEVLSLDPRPSYQEDAERIYGVNFAGFNIRFRVEGDTLHILSAAPLQAASTAQNPPDNQS